MLFYKTEMNDESVDLGHLKEAAPHPPSKEAYLGLHTQNLINVNGSRISLPGLKQTIPEKTEDMKISWNF